MDELFPVITKYCKPDKQLNYYIIVAWWNPGGWWKLFSDLYVSLEKAETEANRLPRGYTERKIFHIVQEG